MKKAGIFLGIFIIILAVVIFVVSQKIEHKKISKGDEITIIDIETTDIDLQEDKVLTEEVHSNKPDKEVEKTIEIIKEISGVSTYTENDLKTIKNVSGDKEEIVVISSKRIMLIDEASGTATNKMLTYCFDVLTGGNQKIVLFMTETTYNSFGVGDKLKVKYKVYTNDFGVELPIVISVNSLGE